MAVEHSKSKHQGNRASPNLPELSGVPPVAFKNSGLADRRFLKNRVDS